jgi:hypothetical protein
VRLAAEHNRRLREKHGLSVLGVAPYATGDGGGMLVSGRF